MEKSGIFSLEFGPATNRDVSTRFNISIFLNYKQGNMFKDFSKPISFVTIVSQTAYNFIFPTFLELVKQVFGTYSF